MGWRVAPSELPDTTLPDNDDSWKNNPESKPGTGKAFREGVVTASEPVVAEVGAEVLANGGNAIDAAAAMVFALNVAEPQSSGIGGGGFMMIHLAKSNETFIINCREWAPAATTPDMFVSQPDFALRSSSGYAVAVPGELLCVTTALDNWGTITLAEALQPAIEAAEEGVVVSTRLANDILLPKLGNEPGNPAYEVARSVFRPDGEPLEAGDLLVQPDLAHTFELIAEHGPDAFYDCDHEAGIARAIVDAQLVTRTQNPDGVGRMTCEDLESYEVEILDPISRFYEGYEVVTMPPPSSGGIALLQMLGMLERFPIGDEDAGFGFGEFKTLNVMIDAMRLAFADRALWVGDQNCPGCPTVPVAGLLSDAYLAQRSALIEVGQRLTGIMPGDPRPYDPEFADEDLFAAGAPIDTLDESDDTTHVSIVDEWGNIVTMTMTIEATWGTGIMVPGYGFLLNNEMTDFNRVPTYNPDPDNYDPGANDAAPFKRPRSSMAPTMLLLDGKPVAAYGSPGGAAIINTLLNFTLNLIDHRMTLRESGLAPRISMTSASDTAVGEREAGFDPMVIAALQALGYQFNLVAAIGAVQAIVTVPPSDKQYGFADPRRIGRVATP